MSPSFPLYEPIDPTADAVQDLYEAIDLLVNSLGTAPSSSLVAARADLLIARLNGESTPALVFHAADRFRDTLATQMPGLRAPNGDLTAQLVEVLRERATRPARWSPEHRQAWARGITPVRQRSTLEGLATAPLLLPAPAGAQDPDLDAMDVLLLNDAVDSLRRDTPDTLDAIQAVVRPLAQHLRHLPPGRCYVLANAFREQVVQRVPRFSVPANAPATTHLNTDLARAFFALTLGVGTAGRPNGDEDDHDEAIVSGSLPNASTAGSETVARWRADARTDLASTHRLVAQAHDLVQGGLGTLPDDHLPRFVHKVMTHLAGQASIYRGLLVLDRLREPMAQNLALRDMVAYVLRTMAPEWDGAVHQMWWDEQRLGRALALAQARSCPPGTPLVAMDGSPDPDGPPALAPPAPEGVGMDDSESLPAGLAHHRVGENGIRHQTAQDEDLEATFPTILDLGDEEDDDRIVFVGHDNEPEDDAWCQLDQVHSLSVVEGLITDLLERPVGGHADLMGALEDLVRTTDTWTDAWFELAWHGVITQALPRWRAHLMPPTVGLDADAPSKDLVLTGMTPAEALGHLLQCTMPPGTLARRALSMRHVGAGLTPQGLVTRRLRQTPLHDPLVEEAAWTATRVREQRAEQAKKGATLAVVDAPLREFRNSGTYAVLAKGVTLRPVGVDLDAWQDAMDADYPWMRSLTARLVRRLVIQAEHGKPLRLPNLALLGKPGVGKTLYWRTALRRLEHPLTVLAMAGSNDSMLIKGTTAGWSTERPGIAAHAMATSGLANPVVLLDEIDKAGGGENNGRSSDALLPLLETSTAATYRDECLLQDVNASHISWVLTLNEEDKLPAALHSRVEIVMVNGPDWSNPGHVDAALRLGEDLAWTVWGDALRTPATALSSEQQHNLRRTRWNSLRSLGQAIEAMVEDNLYQATVEARVRHRAGRD